MAVLARSSGDELAARTAGLLPAYAVLRGPETGLIMVRGRAGGNGAPFNMGEATVARCTVRSETGHVGHAYCLGRDLRQAELAAALDAAMQDPARRAQVEARVIAPLERAHEASRAQQARRAAATQVQFFTMAAMRT